VVVRYTFSETIPRITPKKKTGIAGGISDAMLIMILSELLEL